MSPRRMIASCLTHPLNPSEPRLKKSNNKKIMLEVDPLSESSKAPKFKRRQWKRAAAKKSMQSIRLSVATAMVLLAINLIENQNILAHKCR